MKSTVQVLEHDVDWDLSDPEIVEDFYRLKACEERKEQVEVVSIDVDMGEAIASYYNLRVVSTGIEISAIHALHIVDIAGLRKFYKEHA